MFILSIHTHLLYSWFCGQPHPFVATCHSPLVLRKMLPVSTPESAAPAYDAAEKGTLEDHSKPPSVTTLALSDQTKVDTPLDASKEVIPIPKLLTTNPSTKKKVSKWILWQLWFNPYRYASIMSTRLGLFHSESIL